MRAYKTDHSSEPAGHFGLFDVIAAAGLMIVLAFTALAFGAVEPWSLAVFGMLTIALLVLWFIKGVANRRLKINAPATVLPLLALLLLGVAQGITIIDPDGKRSSISLDAEATWMATEILVVLVIAFLLSANFLSSGAAVTWLRNFLIFFGLALAVFGMVQRFTWNGKYYWVFEPSVTPSAPFGPFVNHNHFAGYLEMLAPIPVVLILRRAVRGELAFLYGFAAAMMGLAVVMSLSRGGMISLIASSMFIVAFGFKPRKRDRFGARESSKLPMAASRLAAMAVIIITIGAGVWWVGADPVIRRVEKGELTSAGLDAPSEDPGKETFFQSRGWIWRDTVAMIRDNWVAGVGLGAYHTAYPIYSKREGTLVVSQSHNDYLQILADGGIFGAIIALSFIFLLARDAVRASRHRNPLMAGTALGFAGGLFALIVHSLFDFNLQIPSNALLFLVMTSVVSQIASSAVHDKDEHGKRSDYPVPERAALSLSHSLQRKAAV